MAALGTIYIFAWRYWAMFQEVTTIGTLSPFWGNQNEMALGRIVGHLAPTVIGFVGMLGSFFLMAGGGGGGLVAAPATGGASVAISAASVTAGLIAAGYTAEVAISSVAALFSDPNIQFSVGNKGDSGANNEVTSNKGNSYDNTPSSNHSTTTENPGAKGEPSSSVDILDKDGNIKTRRWYDENGNAIRDLDMTDHGNPKSHPEVPHEHIWDSGVRK